MTPLTLAQFAYIQEFVGPHAYKLACARNRIALARQHRTGLENAFTFGLRAYVTDIQEPDLD